MGLASFSYINREYAEILSAVIEKIPKITPEWTDWNQSDIGITILQQFSAIAEMLAYTQDQHTNQVVLPTCVQRSVMINLVQGLAYTMASVTAASADLLFTRASSYTTKTDSTTLASSITAQSTYEFTLNNPLIYVEYGSGDVIYLTNGTQSEYAVIDYRIGSKIVIKGVTRYAYSSGNTVSRITSDRNVVIPDNLKCTTSGTASISFETSIEDVSYTIYGGNSYPDQTVVLAYSTTNKTITVTNVFDYNVGDSLYLLSSLFSNYQSVTITAISGRVITVSESLPIWIQVGDTVCRLVPSTHGQTRNETLSASTGLPSQTRDLTYSPVLNSSIVLQVNEGSGNVTWTLVDSFFSSDSNDENYTIEVQSTDKVRITFGDGVNGKVPSLNSIITTFYVQGGGSSGNIGRNTITKIASSISDRGGTTVSLTVNNPNQASGGSDKESLDVARVRAPSLYASAYRAISPSDFESLSIGFRDDIYGSVSNAKVVESQVDNAVSIYVWAQDSNGFATSTSSGLKAALTTYLEEKASEGYLVSIVDGFTKSINITATVTVSSGFVQSVVRNSVLDSINSLFQAENITPGEDFYLSNLYEAIENVSGVDRVDITIPVRPGVPVGTLYMPVRGTVTLTMVGGN